MTEDRQDSTPPEGPEEEETVNPTGGASDGGKGEDRMFHLQFRPQAKAKRNSETRMPLPGDDHRGKRSKALWLAAIAVLAVVLAVWVLIDVRKPDGAVDREPPPPSMSQEPRAAGPRPAESIEVASEEPERTELAPQEPGESSVSLEVPAPSILVRVVDLEGEPVAGATVETFEDSVPDSGTTDETGCCRLAIAPDPDSMRLRVEADGYFHVNAFKYRGEEVTVKLHPVSTMYGRVLEADTLAPVPGASLLMPHGYCKGCEPDRTKGNGAGDYELQGVPRGRDVTFIVEAEGFPRQTFRFELNDTANRVDRDLLLARGTSLTLEVVGFVSGMPLPGVHVRSRSQTVTTGQDGRVHDRFLASSYEDSFRFKLSKRGYCELDCDIAPEDIRPGETLRFELPRTARFEGWVRDQNAKPIAGAEVRIREDHRWMSSRRLGGDLKPTPLDRLPVNWRLGGEGSGSIRSTTDENGHFRSSGLVPWTERFDVVVSHPEFEHIELAAGPVGGPGETTPLQISFSTPKAEGGTISGIVRLNDKPVEGYVRWQGRARSGHGRAGRDGAYEIQNAELGEVILTVAVRGSYSGLDHTDVFADETATVIVRAGKETTHDFDLRLPIGTISGAVLSAAGEPLASERVVAYCEGNRVRGSTQTDQDGTYTLELPDLSLPYTLSAGPRCARTTSGGVFVGTEGVDLVLPDVAEFRYKVVDGVTGENIIGFTVYWRRAGEPDYEEFPERRVPDSSGCYTEPLSVGRHDLMVRAGRQGYRPCILEDILVGALSGEQPRIVELRKGLTLKLVLADGMSPPPRSSSVLLLEVEGWDQVRYWKTELGNHWSGGTFYPGLSFFERMVHFEGEEARLRGLAPGTYRFKVLPDHFTIEPAEIEISSETSAPVEISWRRKAGG